ncbi:MAG TPA: acyl-CoA dehydrogenase [Rhizomicrobium sp.]|nr:acyl-CoA dehydrogenase [Rhizomicrobium sp.]
MTYRAPLRDTVFSLYDVAGFARVAELERFAGSDRSTVTAVLEGAGNFAAGVLAPLNRAGDRQGARFENGRVFAAPGFADAYRRYVADGWSGLAADADQGGQGLPRAVALAAFGFVHAANMSFGLCPMLTEAAVHCLAAHGSAAQKALYLPRLVSGEWTGTMNLTEAQAGSDLALVRCRAEPDGNGRYRLTGQKIFITWGDHDCADNIVHLVLARLPDAPAGVKGISLFLAPKFLSGENGKPGAANALRPLSIEHKLGIHGSPTCVMAYEGATAELIGEPGQGLPQMFTMMNAARLNVGMQGVGIAERAYQQALAFALERRQGRSPWSDDRPARIFDLPDVRRMLVLMKAKIEAARAICLATAVAADLAEHAPGDAAREAARLREELLVPIAKAWSTDVGVEAASLGVQVHGGMGFIEETGAAQHYRDARIAPIYEGTNGIQALDLVGRKLSLANGAAMAQLLADMRATLADAQSSAIADPFRRGIDALDQATQMLLRMKGTPDALAAAAPYLTLAGNVIGGWMHAKAARADGARTHLAEFYAAHVLAPSQGLLAAVESGAGPLSGITPDALAPR